ncbi:MAG: galactokinase, partial [Flavobacteriales bacterium]|nr:galactokinase [Flavobacteriales bacterium]
MVREIVRNTFQEKFNTTPVMVMAPGRINLIGEHTDYNDGFVLPAAIDKAIYFAVSPRADGKCTFAALDLNLEAEVSLSDLKKAAPQLWLQYFSAALAELHSHKIDVSSGFNLVFGGDIPIGAGLSSSAALCCGFLYALSELFELDISRKEIAKMAQRTEHRIGLNCGIMDQYAVVFGQADSFMCLDCRSLEFENYSTHFGAYEMVLINSKVVHELTGSEYNERRNSCERVVASVAVLHPDVFALRDIELEMLENHRSVIDPIDYRRAQYIIEENQRVKTTISQLQAGNVDGIGDLLNRGHRGLSEEFEVS